MIAGSDEAGGLARGVVGSARTIAFGTSIVAPCVSAATVLILVMVYAGFASPLVVLIYLTVNIAVIRGRDGPSPSGPWEGPSHRTSISS